VVDVLFPILATKQLKAGRIII